VGGGGGLSGGRLGSLGAAFVVGDLSTLRVRARVAEEDAPQLQAGARAIARVRGIRPVELPLRMLRIEPLAEPKMNLMGTTTERVDTRVVEVIFEVIGPVTARVYPGQGVDVFIEGEGAGESGK
ncbi:MAG: hypothetical protein ACT4PL_01865, partial [Phycisphaerales bacterium]